MAEIALAELWLHDAADLDDSVVSDGFLAEGEQVRTAGTVEDYAGGRRRLVRRPGQDRAVAVTMPRASASVLAWLRDHQGALVLLRDPRGRKVYGTFLELDVPESAGPTRPDVSFTLEEITHSEEV